MVTNGITYGASQLTSDGVSYTKNGETITVKKALDELITKSSKVDELEERVSDYKKLTIYLADQVQVGDYVIYDVGKWTSSSGLPTTQGTFGGYTSGTSKGKSIETCVSGGNYKTNLNGWRVLTVNKTTHDVTIVHAGQPECYYHGYDPSDSINKLNEKAKEYMNEYAESAHAITKNEVDVIAQDNTLRKTGATYCLATANGSTNLYGVGSTEGEIFADNGHPYGFRPVIVLKANIKTTGKGTDEFGQSAWTLVLPN